MTTSSYDVFMMISPRDDRILQQVARFGQLTSAHIRTLEFDGLKSHTSCYAVLKRLTDKQKLLATVERRGIGGWKGGSGQYVYQLTARAYRYLEIEPIPPRHTVMSVHSMGIADAYVAVTEAVRRGEVTLLEDPKIEVEASVTVDHVQIIPDLAFRLHVAALNKEGRLFVEIDTGTEGREKIEDKMRRYNYLYRHWSEQTFPTIFFLSTRPERLAKLRYKVDQAPPEARHLFRVNTLESFPQLLWSN